MRTQPILHFVRGQVYRIILSRLYYAAHHVGRLMLRNVGLTPEQWRVNIHQRVLDELEDCYVNTGIMRRNAFRALGRLRRLRTQADYELNVPIRNQDISYALNLFTKYLACFIFPPKLLYTLSIREFPRIFANIFLFLHVVQDED